MKLGTKTGTNAKCEGNGFEFSEGNSYFRKNTLGLLTCRLSQDISHTKKAWN